MNIQILEMIEGARQAKGLTVIIDVFRAFSLECYLMAKHPAQLCPVGAKETAYAWKENHPEAVLIGERHGFFRDFNMAILRPRPQTPILRERH